MLPDGVIDTRRDDAGQRGEPVALDGRAGGEQQRGRCVVHSRGVARGHGAALAERGPQLRERVRR